MNLRKALLFLACCICAASVASAQTEIAFWHALSGGLKDRLDAQVQAFNAAQTDYRVIATRKGNYGETLDAGIAAFETGSAPAILMVSDVDAPALSATAGLTRPLHEILTAATPGFDDRIYINGVKAHFSTAEGDLQSLPYNTSTPVLWVNRDALISFGLDPDVDLSTWEQVGDVRGQLKAAGSACPMTTSWQTWIHLENFSAYHDLPYASEANGFGEGQPTLMLNGPGQVAHIDALALWAREETFIYTGRRNAGGVKFRAGDCVLFTDTSAAYASITAAAEFDVAVRQLPYWAALVEAPQNTMASGASRWVLEGQSPEAYRAVAAFLTFLSSAAIQAKWHQDTGYLPITYEATQLTRAQGYYAVNPGTDVAITQMLPDAVTDNSRGLRLGALDQIRGIIDEELEAVWAGEADAQTALDNAKRRGDAVLRRFDRSTP